MSKIRIVKKNDDYSSEYAVGDVFETTGTWYGGVNIYGKQVCRYLWIGMFMSEVDREKYPDVQQRYRFEKVEG